MRFFSISDCTNNSKHGKIDLGKFALTLTIYCIQMKCIQYTLGLHTVYIYISDIQYIITITYELFISFIKVRVYQRKKIANFFYI